MSNPWKWPLSQRCGRHVRFELACPDRLLFRGYAPLWQSGGGLLSVHERLRPGKPLTSSWLQGLRQRFTDGVQRFAAEHQIPVLRRNRAEPGAQEELVAPYRAAFQSSEGIYAIVKVRQDMPVWRSYPPKEPRDDCYRALRRRYCNIEVYYFYGVSQEWGPFWVSLWSNAPFSCQVYVNAHEWLVRQARQDGLEVRVQDNVILGASDPQRLQQLVQGLTVRRLRSFCDRWAYRLLPVLSNRERAQSDFRYDWCIAQAEYSHDLVFNRRDTCQDLFQRLIDCNRRWTGPYTVKTAFGKKRVPDPERITVGVQGQFDTLTVLKLRSGNTWLKQYNPGRARTLRTECTVNDPRELGLGRRLENWPALLQTLRRFIHSFQDCQHPVMTPCLATGALSQLGQQRQLAERRVPGIRLDQPRMLAVLSALGSAAWLHTGVTNRTLRPLVQKRLDTEYTPQQMRYDLSKLTGHGLLTRHGQRYWPTAEGHRQILVLTQLARGVLEPLLSATHQDSPSQLPCYRAVEKPLQAWYRELHNLTHAMGVPLPALET